MNTNNKQFWALLGGEIVLAVLVIVALVGGHQSGPTTDPIGATGTRFPYGISADSTSPSVGEVRGTSLTITGTTITQDEVVVTRSRQDIVTGTTTPCAILSPNATSTLESFVLNLTTSSSTSAYFTIATSTTAYATTSKIFQKAIPASVQYTLNWFATNDASIVSPSTYVVAGVQGGSAGTTFTMAGTCYARFEKAN